LLINIEHNRLK